MRALRRPEFAANRAVSWDFVRTMAPAAGLKKPAHSVRMIARVRSASSRISARSPMF